MRRKIMSLTLLLAIGVVGGAAAEPWDDWCDRRWGRHGWDAEMHCEVREMRLEAPGGVLHVDAAPNGGIRVEGWEGGDIRIVVRVSAWAHTEEDARDLISQVEIETGRTIEARGPRRGRRDSWSADFWLFVPNGVELELESQNGGISIENLDGTLDMRTRNGGISVSNVSGDVRGRTTNGGLEIELTGTRWQGAGLDLLTTNGGVSVDIPENYNGRLRTSTVNGTLRTDFPVTVRGRIDRALDTQLGEGGPTIRARTTNGRVVLREY